MSITLPSLSEDGWVMTDQRQAEYIFSHFFLSDYSQTYIYRDKITSFAWILAEGNGDMTKIGVMTQSRLSTYFSRYFHNVEVETEMLPDPNNPSEYSIKIYLSFDGKDGKNYNLGRIAFVQDSLIKRVVDLSNYGAPGHQEI